MIKKKTDENLESYSKLKVIYGSHHYDRTYRYTTDDLLGDWEKDFYGPIPSFYIGGLKNLGCLKGIDELMVKDGALGLLRFFRTYPNPPDWFSTKLYFKKTLAGLIPPSWKANIQIYEDWFANSETVRNELVIHGVLAKGVCCFERFSEDLKKCLEKNAIKKIHVILRTPVKMEGYYDEDETYGFNELLNILMAEVDRSVSVVFHKLDDLEKINLAKSYYLPLDASDIIYSGLSTEVTMFTRGACHFDYVASGEADLTYNESFGIKLLNDISLGSLRKSIEKLESELVTATNSYSDLDIALLLLT